MKQFDNNRRRFAAYGFSCEAWMPCEMSRADQHDEVELNYLPEGSLTYLMGGRRVVVPPRRLAVFWATVPHQIVEHDGDTPYYVATIPFAWFLKWGVPQNIHRRLMQWEVLIDSADCEPARERFMFEQWLQDVDDDDLAPAVALEIQARLLRLARHLKDDSPGDEVQRPILSESQNKAERMACHISRCYQDRLTIPQIAEIVELHPDYAATLFKRTIGTTIVSFITRHRIAHAQRLLLSTDDQVITIAADSGFDSLSRFNKAFKQLTGQTPREYQRAQR